MQQKMEENIVKLS